MLLYIFSSIIGIFSFLTIKNIFLAVQRKNIKYVYFALFFICYIIIMFCRRFIPSEEMYANIWYTLIFSSTMIFISFICVLIGSSIIPDMLPGKISMIYFAAEVIVMLQLFILDIFSIINAEYLLTLIFSIVAMYAVIVVLFTIIKGLKNNASNPMYWSYLLLMVFLMLKSIAMAFSIETGLYLYAGVMIFILILEYGASAKKTYMSQPASNSNSLKEILNETEYKIAVLLIAGKSYKQTGNELGISFYMINKTASLIYKKAGCRSKIELAKSFSQC